MADGSPSHARGHAPLLQLGFSVSSAPTAVLLPTGEHLQRPTAAAPPPQRGMTSSQWLELRDVQAGVPMKWRLDLGGGALGGG
jgi:hypothetical protein